MSECSHNCNHCNNKCSDADLRVALGEHSHIQKVVAVTSGKGGVGKSSVTVMLAVEMARRGYKVGILDADITGPSIPKAFGITDRAVADERGLLPAVSAEWGIRMMSINLLLDEENRPVVWRGALIANAVTQFWTDVVWGDLDVLFIDMPPGTGDVPLTVFQSLSVDAAVVVTTPQSLVQMVVGKSCRMLEMLRIPILGLVENMSYLVCPECDTAIPLLGQPDSGIRAAEELHIPLLAQLPMDAVVAAMCDAGCMEQCVCEELSPAADSVERLLS